MNMNYSAMIQSRRSVRAFRSREVSAETIAGLRAYYETEALRLFPEIGTELVIVGQEAQKALEGSAGYERFLIGSPHYMVLLSEKHAYAGENAGYLMEDLILKLTELEIDSCWLTFTNSDRSPGAATMLGRTFSM